MLKYILPLFLLVGASAPTVLVASPVINGTVATATITTPTDDSLEGLSSPMGVAMLHVTNRRGMERLAIPFKANQPRILKEKGYHIMLMHKPKTATVPIILIFKEAGEVKTTFKVVG